MGVSKNRGTWKWMVYNGTTLLKYEDLGVPLFLETPIWTNVKSQRLEMARNGQKVKTFRISIEPPPGPTVFVVAKVREKQMRLLQPPAPEDDWWVLKAAKTVGLAQGGEGLKCDWKIVFFESGADSESIIESEKGKGDVHMNLSPSHLFLFHCCRTHCILLSYNIWKHNVYSYDQLDSVMVWIATHQQAVILLEDGWFYL